MQGQSTAMHRVSSQRTMETAGGGCVRLVMIHMMQQLFFAVGQSTSTEVTLLLSILGLFVLLCGSIWHLHSQQPFIGKRRNLMFVFRIVQIHNMETELQFNKQRYKIHKTPVRRILCILYRKFLKNYNTTAGQQGQSGQFIVSMRQTVPIIPLSGNQNRHGLFFPYGADKKSLIRADCSVKSQRMMPSS